MRVDALQVKARTTGDIDPRATAMLVQLDESRRADVAARLHQLPCAAAVQPEPLYATAVCELAQAMRRGARYSSSARSSG
jgi:hypothetical protein